MQALWERKLEGVAALPDARQQQTRLQALFNEVLDSEQLTALPPAVTALLAAAEISLAATKPSLIHLAQALKSRVVASGGATPNDATPGEGFEAILSALLAAVKAGNSHLGALDEVDYMLRDAMMAYYIQQNQFRDAAIVISGANLESSSFQLSDQEKANIYVKCAECCLEEDEAVDAEVFVNKASPFMNSVTNRALQLRYRATNARVLDANRKFIDAALRYYELSNNTVDGIVAEDLLELLGKAATCAILAKAGPQRARMLAVITKDERFKQLEQSSTYSVHAVVLAKMYNEQILRREELSHFEATLQPHQKASTSDGFTIPEKAVIEHNLVAAGNVYNNIKFSELGRILGLSASRAERVVAKMIAEERLSATIDQSMDLLIYSDNQNQLTEVDDKIKRICQELVDCTKSN